MNLFTELKRRNVFRVGLVYLASAWLIAQVAAILVPAFAWPAWVLRAVIIILAVGFPIAVVVAWLFELTPEGLKRTAAVEEEKSIRPLTGRKLDRLLIGVLVLVVAVLLANQFLFERSGTKPEMAGAPAAATGMPSLAVLPFEDFSPNKDQGYLADGLSEELMDKLAQLKGLSLIGRTSAFAFKGKNEDLRTIGEKLGVENVLEGSLRKDGDQIRITAQLINARTGYHLWSETYQRKFDDIFAIQDDISKSVATALSVALGVGDVFSIPGMTRNLAAYEEWLQANGNYATVSPEEIREIQSRLERAVALDPDFAMAWLSLSRLYSAAAAGVTSVKIGNAAAKSDDAFERAQKLIPDSPIVLAAAAGRAADSQDADQLYWKALSAAAGNASIEGDIGRNYGDFLGNHGRANESIGYYEQARAIDPLALGIAESLTEAYADSRNFAAALAEADRGLKLDGDKSNLKGTALWTALASGDKSEIEKRLRLLLAVPSSIKFIDVINARMGELLDDREKALSELRRLAAEPAAQSPIVQGGIIVGWAAALGDPEYALEQLRTMPPTVQRGFAFIVWRPTFGGVRKLPEFKDFMRDVGFVDSWRETGEWSDFCHPTTGDDFECE